MRIRCLLFLMVLSTAAFAAGDTSFTHTVTKTKGGPPPTSNDFWFAVPQNYESQSGKYVQLYVTSNKATTVNVAITGGTTYRFPIAEYKVASFTIPLGWEVTTSGIIEEKGIRVWSNDADLSVYFLSRNPATSDGTNILPIQAWGTEYVVGAYGSLYAGFGSFTYDYPSEFVVFAAYDSTIITITPSADIRVENKPDSALHKKGIPFTVILDKGECIQYQATLAQNSDEYDMTGTVITSTKPVGVIGASQCPNIPSDYSYCDFICEMIPPVTSWGKTYHSLPFANRKGGDSFLAISSKAGQTIYRNNVVFCTLSKKYERFFRPDIADASSWTSDAPFMLAQYINSTTWTDDQGNDNAGIGDPSMMMHLPTTKYSDSVVFQSPTISSGTGFTNYANVIVHDSAMGKTTLNGQLITQYPATNRMKIPFTSYTGVRVRSLSQGTHVVRSDSGVGVNVYGYGSYDSYAWSGPIHVDAIPSTDTISPLVATTGNCNCATITIDDSIAGGSGISAITSDSLKNMSLTIDANFASGSGKQSTYYTLCIIDPAKNTYADVSIVDMAGNRTSVVSKTIGRSSATASPQHIPIAYLGEDIANYAEYTITNTAASPLMLSGASGLRLSKGNVGFSLVSPDLTDLAPSASRVFLVKYQSSNSSLSRDTLLIGNECNLIVTPVNSFNPTTQGATAYGNELKCIDWGMTTTDTGAYLVNDNIFLLNIDSITIDDSEHFTLVSPSLPTSMGLGDTLYAVFFYTGTNGTGYDTSLVHFYTKEAGELTAIAKACVVFVGSVRDGNASNYHELTKFLQQGMKFSWLAPVPNPTVPTHPVSFTFALSHSADIALELFDISGKRAALIASERFAPGIHERYLETKAIASGTYIYRYTIEGQSYTGKLVVE
jgi:hypothetical protein